MGDTVLKGNFVNAVFCSSITGQACDLSEYFLISGFFTDLPTPSGFLEKGKPAITEMKRSWPFFYEPTFGYLFEMMWRVCSRILYIQGASLPHQEESVIHFSSFFLFIQSHPRQVDLCFLKIAAEILGITLTKNELERTAVSFANIAWSCLCNS